MEHSEAGDAVRAVLEESVFGMFAKFDALHQRGITDADVVRILREVGYTLIANDYVEWQEDGMPVREDQDGPLDQGEHLVTDPGDAPSYIDIDINQKEPNS